MGNHPLGSKGSTGLREQCLPSNHVDVSRLIREDDMSVALDLVPANMAHGNIAGFGCCAAKQVRSAKAPCVSIAEAV